jgi:hypothetical protein
MGSRLCCFSELAVWQKLSALALRRTKGQSVTTRFDRERRLTPDGISSAGALPDWSTTAGPHSLCECSPQATAAASSCPEGGC